MQDDTKEKLLNHAERLFAEKGIAATSIRDLTQATGVNVASVNYHFGSKRGLVDQVLKRRIIPLNQARTECLQVVLKTAAVAGERPSIEDLLRALIEPTFEFAATLPESRYFFEMVSRAMSGPDAQVRNIFLQHSKPLFQLVYAAMHKALPELPPAVLLMRLHFSVGALHSAMQMIGAKEPLLGSQMETGNPSAIVEMLLPFLSSGMQAPYTV
jgi:AcrR family transcriptional regulator